MHVHLFMFFQSFLDEGSNESEKEVNQPVSLQVLESVYRFMLGSIAGGKNSL